MSTKTPPKIDVTVDGQAREVYMSYGLLNELTRSIMNPENIALVYLDPDLRDAVLKATLAERKPNGKVIAEADLDEIDISMDHVEALLEWVAEHTMGFMVRSLEKVSGLTAKHEPTMVRLGSLQGGQTD